MGSWSDVAEGVGAIGETSKTPHLSISCRSISFKLGNRRTISLQTGYKSHRKVRIENRIHRKEW
jgi:hypothetical protein